MSKDHVLRGKSLSHILKDIKKINKNRKHKEERPSDKSFLSEMKSSNLKSKKTLTFFIILQAFCFSAMTQMSVVMFDFASEFMAGTILVIGLVLAFTILIMSAITVINGNKKTIAMMRTLGYSQRNCTNSVLGSYRSISYLGFILGTLYQYVLLKIMVDIVFANVADAGGTTLAYNFSWIVLLISFLVYVFVYEFVMFIYGKKIKKVTIKEIMTE